MPRTYTKSQQKPYKKYDSEYIRAAIAEYESSTNLSLKVIAEKYSISKSVLHRHMTRVMRPHGRPKCLNEETELYIIQYINICSDWGYPLDTYDLRLLIKGYLDRIGIKIKRFKSNMPGSDFVDCFLKRHKDVISQRISQNIKRARAAVSEETIENYFKELQISLEGVPLSNIVNYDETNLSDDPGKKKIITKRGVKYPERVMNHSKTSTSLMIAASADGTLLPGYVVYKAAHLYESWTKNGPRRCRYNRTASGWFDSNTFEDWVETVAMPYFENKQGKKILIGDNLSSHLSLNLIRKCKEKEIYFIFLPANSTHLTQPLDVAFFRPMKLAWRDILFTWKKTDGRTQASLPKNCFPQLLKKLFERLETNLKNNILAGFSKTGISPLNKDKVLERLPGGTIRNETCTEEERKAIDETVLKLLSEMRYGNGNSGNSRTNSKRKKINVQAGKSVGEDSDYVESVTSRTTSRINEDVDEGDETNIEPNIKQRVKNPLNNKQKIKKELPSTSGITNRKILFEKQEKVIKVLSEEKRSIQQKPVMEIKENNMSENISLNQDLILPKDQISELELALQDNFDVNNMPVIFEDTISFSDRTDTNKNCKVITILDDKQKENEKFDLKINNPANTVTQINQLKHIKPSVKGKGVGKKTLKQVKNSENKERDEIIINKKDEKNYNATLEKERKGVNIKNLEVKEQDSVRTNPEKQNKMLDKERKKTVKAIPDFHELGNHDVQLKKDLSIQKERICSFEDSELISDSNKRSNNLQVDKKRKSSEKIDNRIKKDIISKDDKTVLVDKSKRIFTQTTVGEISIQGNIIQEMKENKITDTDREEIQFKDSHGKYTEIDNIPLISEESISICENVIIEYNDVCNQMLISDSNNQSGNLQVYKKINSSEMPDHTMEKDMISKGDFTVLVDQAKHEKISYTQAILGEKSIPKNIIQVMNEDKIMNTDREEITLKENHGKRTDTQKKKQKRATDTKCGHSAEAEKKKIRILSNELTTHTYYIDLHKCQKVPVDAYIKNPIKSDNKSDSSQRNKSEPIRSKCKRYYRNDAEILKELMDENDRI